MKRSSLLLGGLALVMMILAACGDGATPSVRVVTPTSPPPPSAEQAATAFATALNSGDLAAFNELLADDFVFTQVPGPGGTEKLTLTGKTAYLLRLAGLMEDNTQLTLSDAVYEGDGGTGKYSVTADNLRAIGVDAVSGTFENTRRNGKLATLDLVTDGPSLQKLGAALAALAPPSVEQLALAYAEALTAGDLPAFNDIFADDYVRTLVPGDGGAAKTTITGKSAAMIRIAVGLENNPVLTATSLTVEGNTATGTFSFSADNLKGIGVDAISGTFTATSKDGKMVTLDTVLDGPSLQKLGAATAPPATNTIAFQDFGWDPDHQGATGSVTYQPIGNSFVATVSVSDLKPAHTYNLYIMENDLTGVTGLDATTYSFTTDEGGAATIDVAKTYEAAEGAPLPAFQVHFLVVDQNVDLAEPLPNPLGVAHPIALACSFPLGFLQLKAPGTPSVTLTGDSVPLFNYGWAPGFAGGNGNVTYIGQNPSFEATFTVGDLKPDHEYIVFMMSSALNGQQTTTETTLTTDASGAGTLEISHVFDVPEGVPLPAFQVHFLVIDRSEMLSDPPNPFGIENPIVLACLFPLGFIQF